MRKFLPLMLFVALFSFTVISCDKGGESQEDKFKKIIEDSEAGIPNYRYVDIDTILKNYNLAKDYNEEMLRLQANYENEVKRHQNSIQSLASTIESKRRNNTYLSEASMNQDLQQLGTMQENAQRSIANMENNILLVTQQGQQTVLDSIKSFVNEYNLKKGYDAIFLKDATLFINPALDITNEVVEGLNARYNKVN